MRIKNWEERLEKIIFDAAHRDRKWADDIEFANTWIRLALADDIPADVNNVIKYLNLEKIPPSFAQRGDVCMDANGVLGVLWLDGRRVWVPVMGGEELTEIPLSEMETAWRVK